MSSTMNDTQEIFSLLYQGAMEPKIVVVGCGGAGNNIVENIHERNIEGIETVAVNTDSKRLNSVKTDKRVHIGKEIIDDGWYEDSRTGERSAERARDDLTQMIDGDIIFIIAGMGGRTGTEIAPIIAQIAREQGAVTIGIAIAPFDVECRGETAQKGIEMLEMNADSTIVLDNNRLLQFSSTLTVNESFSIIDKMVAKIVKNMADQISMSFLSTLTADIPSITYEIEKAMSVETIPQNERLTNIPNPIEANDVNNEYERFEVNNFQNF